MRTVSGISRGFSKLARRPMLAAFLPVALLLAARLAVLPWIPIPAPMVMDEFAFLLQGDTFASGRLTNPTHPHWQHFETIYVIHQPSYMAKYPPGQGFVLAFGQVLLGHPWWGVLLSVVLMLVAVHWMLLGWLPPVWALAGAVVVAAKFSIHYYWLNGYWGGAVAAAGGALVFGALPRILKQGRTRHSVLFGAGLGLLMLTRTYEGLVFSLIPCAVVAVWLFRNNAFSLSRRWGFVAIPLIATAAMFAGLYLAYNWRVTGHPLTLPYQIHVNTYEPMPHFLWGTARPVPEYRHRDMRDFYLSHSGLFRVSARSFLMRSAAIVGLPADMDARTLLHPRLVFGYVTGVLFLAGLMLMRKRRMRIPLLTYALVFLALLGSTWYFDHYAAPLLGIYFLVIMQGLRHAHARLRVYGLRFSGAAPLVAATALASVALYCLLVPLLPVELRDIRIDRPRIIAQLSQVPGPHLIIVRYTHGHSADSDEWVYNRADIDGSEIIWARHMGTAKDQELIQYYNGRQIWYLERGRWVARLSRYAPDHLRASIEASANGEFEQPVPTGDAAATGKGVGRGDSGRKGARESVIQSGREVLAGF